MTNKKVSKCCEYCRAIGTYYKSEINAGKHMFCSSKCAQSTRKVPRYNKVCEVCGLPFKTIDNNETTCCLECKTLYTTHVDDVVSNA